MAQGVDPLSLKEVDALRRTLGEALPEYVTHAVGKALWLGGKRAQKGYAQTLPGRFKNHSKRLGRWFRVYTAGQTLGDLRLGIFTGWPAAEIYEKGGTISPRRVSWLAYPVTPRAYTPGGRIKRSWRNQQGRFKSSLFQGLEPIKVPGGVLLVRPIKATASGRVSKKPYGGGGERGDGFEAVFMLIKQTHRRAILGFYDYMSDHAVDERELSHRAGAALRAAVARDKRLAGEV